MCPAHSHPPSQNIGNFKAIVNFAIAFKQQASQDAVVSQFHARWFASLGKPFEAFGGRRGRRGCRGHRDRRSRRGRRGPRGRRRRNPAEAAGAM